MAETIINSGIKVKKHPLEHYCVPPKDWKANMSTTCTDFINQLELYMDDFILMSQCQSKQDMSLISRKVLHAIHTVFPPSNITGHNGDDPTSVKKLIEGEGL